MKSKLEAHEYSNGAEFQADIKLIFSNCYRYNGAESDVVIMARKLEVIYSSDIYLHKGAETA